MLGCRYFDPNTNMSLRGKTGNPYALLCVAIIHRAVSDYSMVGGSELARDMNGIPVSAAEIRAFFRSRWFTMLTVWCDAIDPEDAIKTMDRRIKDGAITGCALDKTGRTGRLPVVRTRRRGASLAKG